MVLAKGGSSKFSGWVGVLREDFISGSPHAVVDDGSVGALSGVFRKRKTGTYEKCPSKKIGYEVAVFTLHGESQILS